MLSVIENANSQLKALRKAPLAKYFLVGCAKYGFARGYTVSKYDSTMRERLIVERISWGALYSGLYTWGHPYLVFKGARWVERKIRQTSTPSLDEVILDKICSSLHGESADQMDLSGPIYKFSSLRCSNAKRARDI